MKAKDLIKFVEEENVIQYRGYVDCPACGGYGTTKVGLNSPPMQCPTCKGSGMTLAKKPQLVNLGSQERPVAPSKGTKDFTKDPSFL